MASSRLAEAAGHSGREWFGRAFRMASAVVLVGVALYVASDRIVASAGSPVVVTPTLSYHPARANLLSPDAIDWENLPGGTVPVHFRFRSGETLASVLSDLGLDSQERAAATRAAAELTDLRRLRSGDSYAVFFLGQEPVQVHLPVRDEGRIELTRRTGEAWQAHYHPFSRSVEIRSVRGSLEGFLERSIRDAGGDAAAAYLMADVLQWDLDFNRDLQAGDRFEVLYERIYLDHEFHDLGRVLALSYESGERRLTAYQYGEQGSYYDADGRPLQKMFLRSPLRYSRVTSSFSSNRFHPVLKTYRPHYGVDYGAPTGTPVRVTASGVVASAGWENGGGRTVRVRHANGYLTAYLHLSGFAKGVQSGRRVRQGDVVGYVGSSGLASGPHLDYRVQLAGRWINPLGLQNDPAPPIAEDRLPEFFARRDALNSALSTGILPPDSFDAIASTSTPTVAP